MYFSRAICDYETVKYSLPICVEKIKIPKKSIIIDAYKYDDGFYCLLENDALDGNEMREIQIMFSSLPFNATPGEWKYIKYLKIQREVIGLFWKEHE